MDEANQHWTHRNPGPGTRPYRNNGQFFSCAFCGEQFYRRASFIKRGITKTCGKRSCLSQYMMKERNPFWGKEHSPEVREALRTARAARPRPRPRKKLAAPAEHHQHTAEARARIAEATRRRWVDNRDLMLSYIQRNDAPREEQRYRRNFTPWQRKNWKTDKCIWCGTKDNLSLDHIIAVIDGGFNLKENAQTLCQPCNIWKSVYVDRPSHLARLALQSGSDKG